MMPMISSTASHATRIKDAQTPVETISYATALCGLGTVLIARSSKGVCALLIGDDGDGLRTDLAARFPKTRLVSNEAVVRDELAKVIRFVDRPAEGLSLPLDVRGTPFQRRVWERLCAIPAGQTVSYSDLARRVGRPAAVRAVAAACAANPIALAIPCHRVIRGDGDLAGYRWGVERKRELIGKESRG